MNIIKNFSKQSNFFKKKIKCDILVDFWKSLATSNKKVFYLKTSVNNTDRIIPNKPTLYKTKIVDLHKAIMPLRKMFQTINIVLETLQKNKFLIKILNKI